MVRKPGGQPGNRNALKDGFYSAAFTPEEVVVLREMMQKDPADLTAEIAILRMVIQRGAGTGRRPKKAPPVDPTVVLDGVSNAAARLAQVLRAQRVLSGQGSDSLASAFAVALQDVADLLGIDSGA